GRNVRAAPLADGEALRNLLRDEVAEHRELAVEVVVDANHFFAQVRRRVARALEPVAVRRRREDTRGDQRCGVRCDHARRNDVSGKIAALHYACWCRTARAVREENARCYLGRGRNLDRRRYRTEVAAVRRRIWHYLAVVQVALNQVAPFHVVEEEGLLLFRI